MRAGSCARPSRGCSGRSSGTTTTSAAGSRAIRPACRRRPSGGRGGTTSGRTSTTTTSSRCRTSGSIPGTRPGTSRSTRSPSRWSTRTSRRSSSILFLREWYMHPNGQIPAYEWAFGDVNPPVHAWAAWRVYKIEKRIRGVADRRVPRARLPEAAAELHLVGESQGPRGEATSSRAASSASTTSGCSTGRAPLPRGRTPRAVRRHRVDRRCSA